jgi:membrane associated rhomboid family serine protease
MATDLRPGSFQVLPIVIKNLLIINGLVWLAQITVGQSLFNVTGDFALWYFRTDMFHSWQLITYMFLHDPSGPFHLIFNMFGLWMFGSTLENLWGPRRFLIFYFICGIGAGLVHLVSIEVEMIYLQNAFQQGLVSRMDLINKASIPMMGASGAIMGVFAAFAYTFPNDRMFIFPIPFPIKVKWAILGLVAIDLFSGFSSRQTGVAHFAHLGGAAFGIIIVMIWNKKNRSTFY